MAEWSYGSLEDLNDLAAVWKACLSKERRGDHQGLDLGEGLEVGVLEMTSVLTLLEWVSNQSSKTDTGHERGGRGREAGGGWCPRRSWSSWETGLGDGT